VHTDKPLHAVRKDEWEMQVAVALEERAVAVLAVWGVDLGDLQRVGEAGTKGFRGGLDVVLSQLD
jgi:hypothetical protein